MTRDEPNPVALSPDARTNTDPRVQLHAQLEIALENGFGNWEGARGGGVALEAQHGVVVAFLGLLGGRGGGRGAVDGFVEDWIFRIVLLHGTQVIGTLEQVLTLTRGIFCADGLAVHALRRETLYH